MEDCQEFYHFNDAREHKYRCCEINPQMYPHAVCKQQEENLNDILSLKQENKKLREELRWWRGDK